MNDSNFCIKLSCLENASLEFINDNLILYKNVTIPQETSKELFSYQIRGVRFLTRHFLEKTGCILDEDEGMGKTIQSIVFTEAVLQSSEFAACLVLCPQDILLHWEEHFSKWSTLSTFLISDKSDINKIDFLNNTVVIAGTNLVSSLPQHNWKIIILDCADVTVNIRGVRPYCQSCHNSVRIALTNKKLRKPSNRNVLWTLLNFVNPNSLTIGTKKSFVSECVCTIDNLLWFPWEKYYLRLDWMSYRKYKQTVDNVHKKKQGQSTKRIVISKPKIIKKSKSDNCPLEENSLSVKHGIENNQKNQTLSIFDDNTQEYQVDNDVSLIKNDLYFTNVNSEFFTPSRYELFKNENLQDNNEEKNKNESEDNIKEIDNENLIQNYMKDDDFSFPSAFEKGINQDVENVEIPFNKKCIENESTSSVDYLVDFTQTQDNFYLEKNKKTEIVNKDSDDWEEIFKKLLKPKSSIEMKSNDSFSLKKHKSDISNNSTTITNSEHVDESFESVIKKLMRKKS